MKGRQGGKPPEEGGKWQRLAWARQVLELGDRASLDEIKRAYRRLAKERHPDLQADGGDDSAKMAELNRAYRVLLEYCSDYRFPLAPGLEEEVDDDEWWMNRFGNDPVWGRSPGGA